MIPFDEAAKRIGEAAKPLGMERVALADAAGRTLAAPVTAMIDSPTTDSSAMDGYAVRDLDLPGPLQVIGDSFAGHGFDGPVEPGKAVRIFTGAPVPEGADRVIIQEMAEREGDQVTISEPPGEARHIRRLGSDFRAGERLLPAGRRLDPRALVAAAGADLASVEVWRRPRVRILATGDELAPPGQARDRVDAIPESVSFGVAALAEQNGGQSLGSRRLGDRFEAMVGEAGDSLEEADLVVVTGGASVGEKDFAKAMFEPHGLDLIFSKVAIKPGKPVWLGRCAGKLVLGLPGNPTSAMVTARLLLAPLVSGLAGGSPVLHWQRIRLAQPLPACGLRETFHRARKVDGEALPVSNRDSSAQRALAEADLLLRSRPQTPALPAGDEIESLLF